MLNRELRIDYINEFSSCFLYRENLTTTLLSQMSIQSASQTIRFQCVGGTREDQCFVQLSNEIRFDTFQIVKEIVNVWETTNVDGVIILD